MAAHEPGADSIHRPIKYRPDIDGLRAIAVISVVAYHCAPVLAPGGFVGVDIFFVISGYLIGMLVYKEIRGRSFSIAKFYERRAKRILPALFGVLLASSVVAFLMLSPLELMAYSKSELATITSISNFFFLQKAANYYAVDSNLSPLLMTWSLAVEEQFYILLPLLMLLMRRRRWQTQFWVIGGLSALSLFACLRGNSWYPGFAFYMLPSRAWELAGGVLLAMFEANRGNAKRVLPPIAMHGLSVAGAGLIVVALAALNGRMLYPGLATLLPVGGAVLVIAARDGVVNRVLAWRPLVFVGLISYSWYLWHWPMLSFANVTSDTGISNRVGLGIGALSFGCAVLSYYFVERPFRISKTPTARLLLNYGVFATAMMLPAAAILLTNGLPERNAKAAQIDTAIHGLDADVCHVQEPVAHPVLKPPCVPWGDGPAIALIGDSHAAGLSDAIRTMSAANGYGYVEMTKGWCPPLAAGVARAVNGRPHLVANCAEFNRERLAYILTDPRIKAVILAAWWADPLKTEKRGQLYTVNGQDSGKVTLEESRESLRLGLNEMVRRLSEGGKEVYIVQDNPEFTFSPARLMMTRVIGPRRAAAQVLARLTVRRNAHDFAPAPSGPEDLYARQLIATVSAKYPNAHLVDLRNGLCSEDGCRFAEGDRSLYMDTEHLTALGAQAALGGFQVH